MNFLPPHQILIIVPTNLRKQWHQELLEKFNLQGLILVRTQFSGVRTEQSNQVLRERLALEQRVQEQVLFSIEWRLP